MISHAEKRCFKCSTMKPLTSFYRHSAMADGRLNKCKECARLDVAENYQKNIDHYRAYEKARCADRGKNGFWKKKVKKHPQRNKARCLVHTAVKFGRLVKPDACEHCGAKCDPHGHHEDYSKPLDVSWLCAPCHLERHKNIRRVNALAKSYGTHPEPF